MLDITRENNVVQLVQSEDDPVGQAIAALNSAAENLAKLAIDPVHLDKMANDTDYEHVREAIRMAKFASRRIKVRMFVNAEFGS